MLTCDSTPSGLGRAIWLGILAAALAFGGCERQSSQSPATTESLIIEVSSDSFDQEVLTADTLVVVDFWAEWCNPCKILKPTLDELAQEYTGRVKFTALDTDANRTVARQYAIRAIPCLIFFKDGEEVHREIGVQPKENLKSEIDRLLRE